VYFGDVGVYPVVVVEENQEEEVFKPVDEKEKPVDIFESVVDRVLNENEGGFGCFALYSNICFRASFSVWALVKISVIFGVLSSSWIVSSNWLHLIPLSFRVE